MLCLRQPENFNAPHLDCISAEDFFLLFAADEKNRLKEEEKRNSTLWLHSTHPSGRKLLSPQFKCVKKRFFNVTWLG